MRVLVQFDSTQLWPAATCDDTPPVPGGYGWLALRSWCSQLCHCWAVSLLTEETSKWATSWNNWCKQQDRSQRHQPPGKWSVQMQRRRPTGGCSWNLRRTKSAWHSLQMDMTPSNPSQNLTQLGWLFYRCTLANSLERTCHWQPWPHPLYFESSKGSKSQEQSAVWPLPRLCTFGRSKVPSLFI